MKRTQRKEVPALTPLPAGGNRAMAAANPVVNESSAALLRELVAHLRHRQKLIPTRKGANSIVPLVALHTTTKLLRVNPFHDLRKMVLPARILPVWHACCWPKTRILIHIAHTFKMLNRLCLPLV